MKPTENGRKAVQSDGFKRLCKEVVAKCVIAEQPYDMIEARLRILTVELLMPCGNRVASPDEAATFYRCNWQEIDRAWMSTIESMMRTIDVDPAGTISRELGVNLPQPQASHGGDNMVVR